MSKSHKLSQRDVKKELKKTPAWTANTPMTQISQMFIFDDHIKALIFIARITVYAQLLNHHPDIAFSYKKVKVVLTSHEVKGLTSTDFDLAKKIDAVAAN